MKTRGEARRRAEATDDPNLDAQDGETGKNIPVSSVSLHRGQKGRQE